MKTNIQEYFILYALRVSPAVTRLTVYRRLQVFAVAEAPKYVLDIIFRLQLRYGEDLVRDDFNLMRVAFILKERAFIRKVQKSCTGTGWNLAA